MSKFVLALWGVFWVAVFAYGLHPDSWEAPAIDTNGTHMLGLRFMPACAPFGYGVSCGYDGLLLLAVVGSFIWVVFSPPPFGGMEDEP